MGKRIMSTAASILPVIGIALALANWIAKPAAVRAWAAGLVIFMVMLVVRHGGQLAARLSKDAAVMAALVQALDGVNSAIIFAALMMIGSMSMALSRADSVVIDPRFSSSVADRTIQTRAVMIFCGAFLVAMGNGVPRMLPHVSSPRLAGRAQAFHRFVGWTWVLCGLAWLAAWLVLPIGEARAASMTLAAAAMTATVARLVRLAVTTLPHAPGMN